MIPLFDSLLYPPAEKGGFEKLGKQMSSSEVRWGCAIERLGSTKHHEFAAQCKTIPGLVPIAELDPRKSKKDLEAEVESISRLGFRGIKLHARHTSIHWDHPQLPWLIKRANEAGLVTFLCTYLYCDASKSHIEDPFWLLVRLVQQVPDAPIVLMHGGDVRVLQYAEFVRHNPKLVLDLSFTLLKYEGSSLDLDLRFLFNRFDRRICVGTDFPEFSHKDLRRRFQQLTRGVDFEKKENIAYKNLKSLFKMGEGPHVE